MSVNTSGKFQPAPARAGLALADCDFYHTVDIPDHGVVQGQWDLRGREADYLGHVPLAGRSVRVLSDWRAGRKVWLACDLVSRTRCGA